MLFTKSFDDLVREIENERKSSKVKFHLKYGWLRFKGRVKNAWWYIRGVLWDKHNVIKIKNLPPTYCDRDIKLIYACFQVLVDFCDKELVVRPTFDYSEYVKNIDDSWLAAVKNKDLTNQEFWNLRDWWLVERPQNRKEVEDYSIKVKDRWEREEEFDKEDEEKLKRLMELRLRMWT